MKLAIISPYPPIKGGISKETELLYLILKDTYDIKIFSFHKLYPSFLYPSKTQYDKSVSDCIDINVDCSINSINPFTWLVTANKVVDSNITHLLFRFWNPFFIPMNIFIINRIKSKIPSIKIFCICDNIYPHERFIFDKKLIKFFFKKINGFLVMSSDSERKLQNIIGNKSKIIKSFLPLKYTYKNKISKSIALEKLNIIKPKLLLLFFGFIRDYKGLDLLLKALANIKTLDIKLLIAGECYNKKNKYKKIIENNDIKDKVLWHNKYIPDAEIEIYFSACDAVVLPHTKISQSGIIPLAYEFNKIIIASDISSFKENVKNWKTGYLFENNNYRSLEDKIKYIYNNHNFNLSKINIKNYKKKYSKQNLLSDFNNLLSL